MGKMMQPNLAKRLISTVGLAILVLLAGYLALRSIGSLKKGYGWAEMDWNQDGRTSISEFLASSDIGRRAAHRDGQECVEYYAYKDGLPVKVVCARGLSE
jgi:ABC-type antimicrobial peptide transport system permease subunit